MFADKREYFWIYRTDLECTEKHTDIKNRLSLSLQFFFLRVLYVYVPFFLSCPPLFSMLLSMTRTHLPSYPSLLETCKDLTQRLEKSQSNYKASLKTIKILSEELSRNNTRIQRIETFLRDQNALLQEHGLAEYGNWFHSRGSKLVELP